MKDNIYPVSYGTFCRTTVPLKIFRFMPGRLPTILPDKYYKQCRVQQKGDGWGDAISDGDRETLVTATLIWTFDNQFVFSGYACSRCIDFSAAIVNFGSFLRNSVLETTQDVHFERNKKQTYQANIPSFCLFE